MKNIINVSSVRRLSLFAEIETVIVAWQKKKKRVNSCFEYSNLKNSNLNLNVLSLRCYYVFKTLLGKSWKPLRKYKAYFCLSLDFYYLPLFCVI